MEERESDGGIPPNRLFFGDEIMTFTSTSTEKMRGTELLIFIPSPITALLTHAPSSQLTQQLIVVSSYREGVATA